MHKGRWLIIVLGVLLLGSGRIAPADGGGKAAYRHYVRGTFYFSEGWYSKALNNLERAHELAPEEYVFNLALALARGKEGQDEAALSLLNRSDQLLTHDRQDYDEMWALRHFITGLIHLFVRRYYQAVPALKEAIRIQETLDNRTRLASMYNALGYAQVMNQGRGSPSRHSDLTAHYHVHRRDLEAAQLHFQRAVELDQLHGAAGKNYLALCDTLRQTPVIVPYGDTTRRQPSRFVSAKYEHLPARMDGILDFAQYDELVYLLDISGSMVQEQVSCVQADRFRVMKETALYLLDNVPAGTQLGIGTIGGDCGTEPRLWHPVGSRSTADLRWDLRFLVPDGTTPMLTILQRTPELFSEQDTTTKALFFISDGENICGLPGVDICEWTSELTRRGIQVNVLTFLGAGLSNDGAFAEYTCLAERTGGQVLFLDGNRCALDRFDFDLVDNFQLLIPALPRVNCWGPAFKDLWSIFPEEQ